jgi:hypothetical protein
VGHSQRTARRAEGRERALKRQRRVVWSEAVQTRSMYQPLSSMRVHRCKENVPSMFESVRIAAVVFRVVEAQTPISQWMESNLVYQGSERRRARVAVAMVFMAGGARIEWRKRKHQGSHLRSQLLTNSLNQVMVCENRQ